MLNPNTYFSVSEINDNYQTPSALHLIYGDKDDTGNYYYYNTIINTNKTTLESEILVRGLTADDMEHQIKAAVEVLSYYQYYYSILIIIIIISMD